MMTHPDPMRRRRPNYGPPLPPGTRPVLVGVLILILAWVWFLVWLTGSVLANEPECPTTTTTAPADLPCGFTDGIPPGCYDPQPGDPCYDEPPAPRDDHPLPPPAAPPAPAPAVTAPRYTG